MERRKFQHLVAWALLTLSIMVVSQPAPAQQSGGTSGSQGISQSGLLPVYGADVALDKTWVDSTSYPSQSSNYPNAGTSAAFQKVWDTLKPAGFNVLRFRLDVRETQSSANRLANLCTWAKANNVNLIPVLIGSNQGQPLGSDYSGNLATFVKAVTDAMKAAGGSRLGDYAQILCYQLDDRSNHAAVHGAASAETVQLRLFQAASSLRKAEDAALKDSTISATPLMVTVSFDYELIKAHSVAGVSLTDASFGQAYASLKQFLSEIATSSDIDLIGIEWLPSSLGSGSADKLPVLIGKIKDDFAGKQILTVTGFSTAFNSAADQSTYYAAAFATLADYRVQNAASTPFLGVIFREALASGEPDPVAPTATTVTEMASWDWSKKAGELAETWSGKSSSQTMAWWAKKVENNLGLVAVKTDGSGAVTFTPQPAKMALDQIAGATTQVNASAASGTGSTTPAATTTPSTPQPPESQATAAGSTGGAGTGLVDSSANAFEQSLKMKMQEGLSGLLDKVFQKLGEKIAGKGKGPLPGPWGGPATPGTGGLPPALATAISIAASDVQLAPSSPKVGEQVACDVTVHNTADVEASGLTVALVDASEVPLGKNSQQSGVTVGAKTTKKVQMMWTPAAAGPVSFSASAYDSQLKKVASAPLTVTVAQGSGGGVGGGQPAGGQPAAGSKFAIQGVSFTPSSAKQGSEVTCSFDVVNNSGADVANVDVLLIDPDIKTDEALLTEVDGNSIPNGSKTSVALKWTPTAAKSYNLITELWIGKNGFLDDMSLPSLTVGAGDSSGGGTGTPTMQTGAKPGLLLKGSVAAGTIKPALTLPGALGNQTNTMTCTLPVGLPEVRDFAVSREGVSQAVSFTLVNPYATSMSNVSLTLALDEKKLQTKSIDLLLPGQARAVTFSDVPVSRGAQNIQVLVQSGQNSKLSGEISSRVAFRPGAVLSTAAAPTAGREMIAGRVRPARSTAKVRPLTPETVTIRGSTLRMTPDAGTAAASVAPTTPTRTRRIDKSPTRATTERMQPLETNTAVIEKSGTATETAASGTAPARAASEEKPSKSILGGVLESVLKTRPSAADSGAAKTTEKAPAPTVASTARVRPSTSTGTTARTAETPVVQGRIMTIAPLVLKPDLAVTAGDIRCNVAQPKAGETVTFSVDIKNLAKAEAKGAKVLFVLTGGGKEVARKEFTIDAGAERTSALQWEVKAPSARQMVLDVSITLDQDAAGGNNHASTTLNLRQQERVPE